MPAIDPRQQDLAELQEPALGRTAFEVAGFRFGEDAEFASATTVSGLRAGSLTFSQRHDSLTIFATDSRYGYGRDLGAWTGSERELSSAAATILESAGVDTSEIADVQAVSEFGAAAERLSETEFRMEETELMLKTARARRVIDGIPVWSSYAKIGLTAEGRLGCLELHWPHIPPVIVKEAALLSALVTRGGKPPEVAGTKPESIEVGILHSPAIGFFMDVVAAIRVIYLGEDPAVGRKATQYLDRHGQPVPTPRDIPRTEVAPGNRTPPDPEDAR